MPGSRFTGIQSERILRQVYVNWVATVRPMAEAREAWRKHLLFLESQAGRLPSGAVDRAGVSYYALLLGDTTRSLAIADSLVREQPTSRSSRFRLAVYRALVGDRPGALQTEQAALALPAPRLDRGATEYWRAGIALSLGDRDGAVRLLRDAVRQGVTMTSVYSNELFRTLHGYAPFEALITR
jgi:hypothetical protein